MPLYFFISARNSPTSFKSSWRAFGSAITIPIAPVCQYTVFTFYGNLRIVPPCGFRLVAIQPSSGGLLCVLPLALYILPRALQIFVMCSELVNLELLLCNSRFISVSFLIFNSIRSYAFLSYRASASAFALLFAIYILLSWLYRHNCKCFSQWSQYF